jgi:ATP-dependent helicase/nuclease subunit A
LTPSPPRDAEARRRAATEFDRNWVVEAGAGTGKTSLLVERVLVGIGSGRMRVDDLAAITFTEKAAGEMRDRLAAGLDALHAAARGGASPDLSKAWGRALAHLLDERKIDANDVASRALGAIESMDRAVVTTIHTFCADLLRTHPVEAGVDPRFEVDKGPIYDGVLDEAWERFLASELGPEAPRATLWRRLLAKMRPGECGSFARCLAAFRIPEALLAPGLEADAREIFGDDAGRLIGRIDAMLGAQTGMTANTVAIFGAYRRALDRLTGSGFDAFREFAARDDVLADRLRKGPPEATAKLRGVDPSEMEGLAAETHSLLSSLSAADPEVFSTLVEAVAPFARAARRALLARGAVGFDGLLSLARELLRDHPDVREAARRRYRTLLVDEFQDTDPIQYEIVLFLAGVAGETESDPFDVPLEPGRLFIVGDPKQSIYRFRGADYGAYRRAVDRVIAEGGEGLALTTNFRSVPALIAPVNRLFGSLWKASPYQPDYVAIDPAPGAGAADGPRIEIVTVDADGGAGSRREREGIAIAARILDLAQRENRAYGEMMLLLRSFTNLPRYLRPLRDAGIPFVVDGGKEFVDRPEVAQLLAALRAISRPSDPVALLAFLRSPAGGVTDTELLAYAAERGAWSFGAKVDEAAFPAIARSFDLLRGLASRTELPADALVRRVLESTGLLPLGAFAYEGAQRVANLRKLAAAAAALTRDGKLSLDEVIDALEDEDAGVDGGDSPLADEAADAVRVLTIHKAKGLESKVVLVADLAWEDRGGRGKREETANVACLPSGRRVLALRGASTSNPADVWFKRDEKRHDEAQELRTLYVALTRAMETLVLFAARPSRGGKAPWIDALAAWGYSPDPSPADGASIDGGRVLHRIAPASAPPRAPKPPVREEPEAVAGWVEATRVLAERARPPFRKPSGIKEERLAAVEAADAGGTVAAPGRDTALAAGTAVHAALERWDPRSGAPIDASLPELARRAADEHGADAAEVERDAREVLDAFVASPLAAKLRSVEVLGREVPLLLHEADGTTVTGILDLLYRDTDGSVVVADYKTDRALDRLEASARYGPQLALYAETVRRALSLPSLPRTELWLVRNGDILVFLSKSE